MKTLKGIIPLFALVFAALSGCGEPSDVTPPAPPPEQPAAQYYDPMDALEGWSERGASLSCGEGAVTIANTTTTKTYGSVSKRISINTVDFPFLEFGISRVSSGSRWALNINAGGGEFSVYSERASMSIFSVDLRKWPELKDISNGSVTLCFYSCGDVPGHDGSFDVDFIKTEREAPFAETFDNLSRWKVSEGLSVEVEAGVAFLRGSGTLSCELTADFRNWTSFDVIPFQMNGSYRVSLGDAEGKETLLGESSDESAQKFPVPDRTDGTFTLTLELSGETSFDAIEVSATTLFSDSFDDEAETLRVWREVTARVDVLTEDGERFARLTEGSVKGDSGYIETPVYVNASLFKYVRVEVLRLDPGTTWSLKCLYNGSEVTVFNGSGVAGTYYADLTRAGITGSAKFDLRLCVIGNDKTVDFGGVSIVSAKGTER